MPAVGLTLSQAMSLGASQAEPPPLLHVQHHVVHEEVQRTGAGVGGRGEAHVVRAAIQVGTHVQANRGVDGVGAGVRPVTVNRTLPSMSTFMKPVLSATGISGRSSRWPSRPG